MAKAAKIPKRTVRQDETPPPPPLGHNGSLTQDDFHILIGEVIRKKAAVEAVKKGLKEARRRAQDAGINLHDMDEMLAMREQEPETVQETIRRKAQYASWMGLAPGVQPDLFTHAAEKQDEEDAAEQEGYIEGLEGATAKGERYDTTTIPGQARLRGWNRGQEKLKDRLLAINEEAKAKKKTEKEASKKKGADKEESETTH